MSKYTFWFLTNIWIVGGIANYFDHGALLLPFLITMGYGIWKVI